MKRSLQMIGLATVLALPAVVSAQTARPVSLGISGGLSLPMGDLSDGVESGYHVAGHLGFQPASFANLGFRADVSFDRWGSKAGDGNFRALGVAGNAVYNFPQSTPGVLRPYVLAGVGAWNTKSKFETSGVSVESESTTDLGFQAGAGVRFNLSGFSTFIEAKYVNVFGEDAGGNSSSANWIPISFGIRF